MAFKCEISWLSLNSSKKKLRNSCVVPNLYFRKES